jgi:spore maturation protein CgeB
LNEFLLPILSNYSNYKIYGSNWPTNLQITKIDNNKEAKFLSECKILVCISESQSIRYGIDIPERVYKAILSGALVIHDNVFEIEKIIPDIVIFKNCNELKEKIDYYLINEDERKEKANGQYNTVKNNYTYFNVIDRMFRNLKD